MPSDLAPLRFLADMGVGLRVVRHLRALGHDIVHLADQGLQRLPDQDIFSKAIIEKRIILTFDLDFGEIVMASRGATASVIIFRLPSARPEIVIERITAVLGKLSAELIQGAVVTVEPTRVRVRVSPILPS